MFLENLASAETGKSEKTGKSDNTGKSREMFLKILASAVTNDKGIHNGRTNREWKSEVTGRSDLTRKSECRQSDIDS